jgi:hypothetical protein
VHVVEERTDFETERILVVLSPVEWLCDQRRGEDDADEDWR